MEGVSQEGREHPHRGVRVTGDDFEGAQEVLPRYRLLDLREGLAFAGT